MSCALKVKNLSVLVQQIGTNSYRVGALRVEYIEEWQKYRGGKRMLVFVQSWQVQPPPQVLGAGHNWSKDFSLPQDALHRVFRVQPPCPGEVLGAGVRGRGAGSCVRRMPVSAIAAARR